VGDTPLGRMMLRIASRYARQIQAHLSTTGHLFERRYHAVMVDADEYLLELLRYIHLNPVRAGMVTDAAEYPWSSHQVYLGGREEAWVTTDVALSMFHLDRSQAIAAYRRFVEQPPGGRPSPLAQLNPNDARVLGDDQFLARVLAEAWRPRSRKTLQQLAEEACQPFSVDLVLLQSGARQRHLTAVRAWIAHQALKQRIGSVCEVARFLNRSESALRECLLRHHPPERQTTIPETRRRRTPRWISISSGAPCESPL
jgi:putative transposase